MSCSECDTGTAKDLCSCPECTEHGGRPNPSLMKVKIGLLLWMTVFGFYGMLKERSWKALAIYFSGFALFWTEARRQTCARCERYGEMCYSFYLGKASSMLVKQQDKEITLYGMFLEGLALLLFGLAPAYGLKNNKKLLAIYMFIAQLVGATHVFHACRHCAKYSTGWQRNCPSAILYRALWL